MDSFDRLKEIVKHLRGENGCPWDKAQTLQSMRDDFIEEVYEAVEALDRLDIDNIREELGDVLLHVVLHAQIAEESGLFNIDDVIRTINGKLIRRHPHVFGGEVISDKDMVIKRWEQIKREEKANAPSLLDKANKALPPLEKAHKLQACAAKAGFDFPTDAAMLEKVEEELLELKNALLQRDVGSLKEETGDLLFAIVNLARRLNFTASEALRGANDKFVRRFNYIQAHIPDIASTPLAELDALWEKAKKDEQI
ncbi:MAG: nucleoside triphosphate pyrophosphohydrolase [Deferribacteraceae bacterium]|jgi:tetrapyrrole methylase family protein/MazG family protein|nr:nucleoside triphosphate pyrophosphohydrolase [Deferribacteraceae bacterium]